MTPRGSNLAATLCLLVPVSYHSQQIPFKFMGLLWLLNLSRSQSSWPQRCDCGGGHYGSAQGLEMTRVTDDIRESHSPRQSLLNFSNRNEVAELAECLHLLSSFSSQLNYCFQKEISELELRR